MIKIIIKIKSCTNKLNIKNNEYLKFNIIIIDFSIKFLSKSQFFFYHFLLLNFIIKIYNKNNLQNKYKDFDTNSVEQTKHIMKSQSLRKFIKEKSI